MSTSEKVQSYNVGKSEAEDIRAYNVGASDYAQHKIQPWDIYLEYNLNPWDADIVKRVLRTKKTDTRIMDYEKIIHTCKERIRQLSKEVSEETKVATPAEAEKPVEDEESDDTTVFCLDETMKPAMFYTEGEKWNGKYVGYSVFINGNSPYMYLGVDAEGNHLYADLSELEQWFYTSETHLPPKTFKLKYTNHFGNHRSSLKIGYEGKNYEKYDYIIAGGGILLRYFGMEGDKFSYRIMSAKLADGTYPEYLSNVKLENKAIQFTL